MASETTAPSARSTVPPSALSYYAPGLARNWPIQMRPLLSFMLGFTTSAAIVSFVSNFVLKQYNGYLQWDLTFGFELIVSSLEGFFMAALIAIAAAFVKRLRGHVQFPGRLAMFFIGLIHAALSTVPRVIDIATTHGPLDDSGNPPERGWGATSGTLIFMVIPLLLIAWIFARSCLTQRKAPKNADQLLMPSRSSW